MLSFKIGYERACGILEDLFGYPHEVSRSLPGGVFRAPKPVD